MLVQHAGLRNELIPVAGRGNSGGEGVLHFTVGAVFSIAPGFFQRFHGPFIEQYTTGLLDLHPHTNLTIGHKPAYPAAGARLFIDLAPAGGKVDVGVLIVVSWFISDWVVLSGSYLADISAAWVKSCPLIVGANQRDK